LKFNTDGIKRTGINILVDVASVIIILAGLASASLGLQTLYASYYNTLFLPTPESFSTAAFQLSASISSIFAWRYARSYRQGKPETEG